MGKKTSIFLLTLITLVLAFLSVMTFVNYQFKNSVMDYNSVLSTVGLGVDLDDGTCYELELKNDISSEDEDMNIDSILQTLSERVSALGYDDYRITAYQTEGNTEFKIKVELEEKDSNDEDIKVVAAYGEVELADGDGNILLTGKDAFSTASYKGETVSGGVSYYSFDIKFTDKGIEALKTAVTTAEASDKEFTMNINLGGETLYSETVDSTFIEENLSKNTLSLYTQSESMARQQALQIKTGGLAQEYEISASKTNSPLLGVNASKLTAWAVIAAVILLIVLLPIFYKGLGLVADYTITFTVLLELLVLISLKNAVVNVGGIVGILAIILLTTVEMIAIFETIKKEFAKGKTVKFAVNTAYKSHWMKIVDTNVILGVIALSLVFLGKTVLKSFAATFGIGIIISTIMTAFISQMFIKIFLGMTKKAKFYNLKKGEEA